MEKKIYGVTRIDFDIVEKRVSLESAIDEPNVPRVSVIEDIEEVIVKSGIGIPIQSISVGKDLYGKQSFVLDTDSVMTCKIDNVEQFGKEVGKTIKILDCTHSYVS